MLDARRPHTATHATPRILVSIVPHCRRVLYTDARTAGPKGPGLRTALPARRVREDAPSTALPMIAPRQLFLLCYAMSGAAALVYEVAWTRLLTLQIGHTVAAVSTILAAFMGGLSLGAWLAGRVALTRDRRLIAYAALEVFVAAVAVAFGAALRVLVPSLGWAYADGDAPMRFALIRATLAAVLIVVPTAAMGATFPIAAAWFAETGASRRARASSADAGALYAANTAG